MPLDPPWRTYASEQDIRILAHVTHDCAELGRIVLHRVHLFRTKHLWNHIHPCISLSTYAMRGSIRGWAAVRLAAAAQTRRAPSVENAPLTSTWRMANDAKRVPGQGPGPPGALARQRRAPTEAAFDSLYVFVLIQL